MRTSSDVTKTEEGPGAIDEQVVQDLVGRAIVSADCSDGNPNPAIRRSWAELRALGDCSIR